MSQESWQRANCFFWWCRSTSVCPKNSCRIRQAICNAIIRKIDDWGLRGANTLRLLFGTFLSSRDPSFERGLRRSGQMLCTVVTSVPGSETILYWLNWILKLVRWWLSCAFEQLDIKHLRDDYWDEFYSSQHFGDVLQMYYHHVFIFAFFDTSLCHLLVW